MLHLYSAISLCSSVHHAMGSYQIYVVLALSESADVSLKSRDNKFLQYYRKDVMHHDLQQNSKVATFCNMTTIQ